MSEVRDFVVQFICDISGKHRSNVTDRVTLFDLDMTRHQINLLRFQIEQHIGYGLNFELSPGIAVGKIIRQTKVIIGGQNVGRP